MLTLTIEAFSSEESLISVVCLILRTEEEKPSRRRLRGFRNLEWEEGWWWDRIALR